MNKFTSGLLIGTLLGIVIAPVSGHTTRSKIASGAKGLNKNVRRFLKSQLSDLDKLQNTLEDESTEITAEIRQQLISIVKKRKKQYKKQ